MEKPKHWIRKSELRKYYEYTKEKGMLFPSWQEFEDYVENYEKSFKIHFPSGIKIIDDENKNGS